MTKTVRIENADMSNYKVKIDIWETRGETEHLVETANLDFPTAMKEINIWENRYLVIRENGVRQ